MATARTRARTRTYPFLEKVQHLSGWGRGEGTGRHKSKDLGKSFDLGVGGRGVGWGKAGGGRPSARPEQGEGNSDVG